MNLKCFNEIEKYVELAKKGIPFRVVLDVEEIFNHNEDFHANNYLNVLGFKRHDKYKYCTILGELSNMPNHYVVVGNNGQIISGISSDIFYIDMEDEENEEGDVS